MTIIGGIKWGFFGGIMGIAYSIVIDLQGETGIVTNDLPYNFFQFFILFFAIYYLLVWINSRKDGNKQPNNDGIKVLFPKRSKRA